MPSSAGSYPLPALPDSWSALRPQLEQPYFHELRAFLDEDARQNRILPSPSDVFRALELTAHADVRVLLLGQDPYPTPGHAHGLCFSVRPGVKPPASLRNMYRELRDDTGIEPPSHGSLAAWARRGVLMLNSVLTVRAGEPNSHRGRGWETFTDEIIRHVSARNEPVVFALWGRYAQKKTSLIDTVRHAIVTAAHPSPLSARKGYIGSHVYSRINEALVRRGVEPVDWSLPERV